MALDEKNKSVILRLQRNEITEHFIYRSLAQKANGENARILSRISDDELLHYNEWREYTETDIPPDKATMFKFLVISRLFGLTFALKMMETGESEAERKYAEIATQVRAASGVLKDEIEHERLLVNMINEEKINYISSMVLGINDALVELTGALAGLTFTLQDSRLIGAAGLITGIAASLSMSASEYLSQQSEKGSKSPIKASIYTGIAYILTVLLLIIPYFIFSNCYSALGVTILSALAIIFVFTFFISVVRELSFRKMVLQMMAISLGVAAASFVIGWAARELLDIGT